MDRIDALVKDDRPLASVIRGSVLDTDVDPILQRAVEDVAQDLAIPIALVSLVLQRTQFFRSHHGLPAELVATRGTERDASFCQFVVRDGATFEVNDAPNDPRVPQELVKRYGIGAYLGEPVTIDGTVIGSLCCIDAKPRQFTAFERERLAELAKRVSGRMQELSRRRGAPTAELLARASAPAFMEIRNILATLTMNASEARLALVDLGLHARQQHGYAELDESLRDIARGHERIIPMMLALERLMLESEGEVQLQEVLDAATRLAHHQSKLVGGVTWQAPAAAVLATPRIVAVSVLSTAITRVAAADKHQTGGVTGKIVFEGNEVVLELSCTSDAAAMSRAVDDVAAALGKEATASVEARGLALGVRLRLAPSVHDALTT